MGRKAAQVGEVRVHGGRRKMKVDDARGWVMEHVGILEQKIGRRLDPGEFVRFIDGDDQNVTPDNIGLTTVRRTPAARTEQEALQRAMMDVARYAFANPSETSKFCIRLGEYVRRTMKGGKPEDYAWDPSLLR